jgi:hypothetical protein
MKMRRRKPFDKTVRSGFEARIKQNLEERGINYGYESLKLRYNANPCPHCGKPVTVRTYTPDFILHGRLPVVVEAKGRFTSTERTKMRAVKRDNPKIDIRFLFQRDQFIRAGSKTRYTSWAEAHGFPFAIGESIPQEWIPKDNKKGK